MRPRDEAVTTHWGAVCKDCRSRRAALERNPESGKHRKAAKNSRRESKDLGREYFEYPDEAATRTLERGGSRSDRCPECRRSHRDAIRAFPVAYVDIKSIGTAQGRHDPQGPTGPLGGLGPLPAVHESRSVAVDLSTYEMGLQRKDALGLIELMSENQVVVLEAGTGTGKSTLAPFRLMNPPEGAVYRPTDIGPIVVTEPRILATTEIATFVGESMCFGHDPKECTSHVGPGYPVGYQCKGKKVWDESCQLLYVTDGTMLNWIANGELRRFSTVVIDEAHERSETIDGILTLLRANLHRYPALKVVIASATIDPQFFTDFFAGAAQGVQHLGVDATKSIGYGVPLFPDLQFDDERLANGLTIADVPYSGWSDEPSRESDQRNLRDETRRLINLRAPARPSLDNWLNNSPKACADQAMRIMEAVFKGDVPPGDVIAFLSGRRQCEKAKQLLQKRADEAGLPVKAYWLMKDTDEKEKKLATSECPPGQHKVVFASNLAETSLTIPGLRYVVDSGLVNQRDWHADIATETVGATMHSRSGVRQRWGRVGRKTYGWVFPLYSTEQFAAMPKDTPAGSTAVNLEPTLLRLASAGVSDLDSLVFPANFTTSSRDQAGLEAAEKFSAELKRARKALTALGAITADGDVTSFGAELARSRLPPERTTALLFADRLACVPETALALIALDGGSLVGSGRLLRHEHSWPAAWAVHARTCHEALTSGCEDDLDIVLRIFTEWEAAANPDEWADRWWVDAEALEEIREESYKLINVFAPGMAEEAARRRIDRRLSNRVRAVFSRTLASLRYKRKSTNEWVGVLDDREGSEAAVLAPERLVEPIGQIVALKRDFPRPSWGIPCGSSPVLYGVVNVLDWACSDALDPFDLMLAASSRLRGSNGDLIGSPDPLSSIREAYPPGTTLRGRLRRVRGGSGLVLAEHEVLSTGFNFAQTAAASQATAEGAGADRVRQRTAVYRGVPTNNTESAGELGRQPANVAGAEPGPEDFGAQPRNIKDLEAREEEPVEVAAPSSPPQAPVRVAPAADESTVYVTAAAALSLPAGEDLLLRIVGHDLVNGAPGLRLEEVSLVETERADPSSHDDLYEDDEIDVVAGGLARSHFATFRVLHRCDTQGRPDGMGCFFYDGPMLDEWDIAGSEAIEPGSRWRALVGVTDEQTGQRQRISILGELSERFIEASGLKPILTRPTAAVTMTGEVVGLRAGSPIGDELFIVKLDVLALRGFDARVFVPMSEARNLPAKKVEIGSRVRLRVGPKLAARRSGAWAAADVTYILEKYPGYFKAHWARPELFDLASAGPLTDDGLTKLVELNPSNSVYRENAARLWESSRRIGALPKPELELISPAQGASHTESDATAHVPPGSEGTAGAATGPRVGHATSSPGPRSSDDQRVSANQSAAPAATSRPAPRPADSVVGWGKASDRERPLLTHDDGGSRPRRSATPVMDSVSRPARRVADRPGHGEYGTRPVAPRQKDRRLSRRALAISAVAVLVAGVLTYVALHLTDNEPRGVTEVSVGFNPHLVLLSPDGSKAFVVSAGCECPSGELPSSLDIIETSDPERDGSPFKFATPPQAQYAAISARNGKIYLADNYGGNAALPDTAILYDIKSATPESYEQGIPRLGPVAVSPDGSRVYFASTDGRLTVRTGMSLDVVGGKGPSLGLANPSGLLVSADGSRVFATAGATLSSVRLSSSSAKRAKLSDTLVDFADDPPLSSLFVLTGSQLMRVNADSLKVTASSPPMAELKALVVSGDGNKVFVLGDSYVAVVDAHTLQTDKTVSTSHQNPSQPADMAVSADGKTAYITDPVGNQLLIVPLDS